MASIMDILKIKPFVEVSVGQLLWGYEDPLLKLAKDVVPKEQKLPYEEFGLLYGVSEIPFLITFSAYNNLLLKLSDFTRFSNNVIRLSLSQKLKKLAKRINQNYFLHI